MYTIKNRTKTNAQKENKPQNKAKSVSKEIFVNTQWYPRSCKMSIDAAHIIIISIIYSNRVAEQEKGRWNWEKITFSQQVARINLHDQQQQIAYPNVQTKQQLPAHCYCRMNTVCAQSCHKISSIPLFTHTSLIFVYRFATNGNFPPWKRSRSRRRRKKCKTSKINKKQRERASAIKCKTDGSKRQNNQQNGIQQHIDNCVHAF